MKGYIPSADKLAVSTSGYRIKYYRILAGLTQKQLAEKCGLNESTIRNYELDNRKPDQTVLTKIAQELGVSYYSIASTDLSLPEGAIHALFDMEDLYGAHPEIMNNKLCIVFDSKKTAGSGAKELYLAVKDWLDAYEKQFIEDKDPASYDSWRAAYPDKDSD